MHGSIRGGLRMTGIHVAGASRTRALVLLLVASLLAGLGVAMPVERERTLAVGSSGSNAIWYVGPGTGSGDCAAPDFQIGVAGDGSDDAAIQAAVDAASTGDTVFLCDATYDLTTGIDVSDTDSTVTFDSLVFQGESTAGTIVDGGDAVRLFDATGRDVTFVGLTLTNGYADGNGGAVTGAAVAVVGATFTGNSVTGYGGAIEATSGVSMTDGTFTGNEAFAGGGAISTDAAAAVNGGSFEDNTTGGEGGAIYATGLTVPGVYLVSLTTGESCASATPGWGVVTVGATARPNRSTLGAVVGGKHFFAEAYGLSASFGLRVDSTTSTSGKGRTATVTTRTNLRFIWVSSNGWRLTASTTGDATTVTTAAPWQKAASCAGYSASDGIAAPVTLPRGTVCGQLAFRGTLQAWDPVAADWSAGTEVEFWASLVDGGATRGVDNTDWFGVLFGPGSGEAPTLGATTVRPLRERTFQTSLGRLFIF